MADRRFLGGGIVSRRAAARRDQEQEDKSGAPHADIKACTARAIAMASWSFQRPAITCTPIGSPSGSVPTARRSPGASGGVLMRRATPARH